LTRLANVTHPSPNIVHLLAEPLERLGERAFFLPLAQSNLESLLSGDEDTSWFTESAWRQIHPLAQALSAIHKNAIVHGDLKPENILVFRTSDIISLKIADFGHSICDKLTAESSDFFANGGAYPLNPLYSPPELWKPDVINLEPCDVWALGCVFLELSVFLHGGSEDVKQFRKLRISPIGNITMATFHDTRQLKPQVCAYLEKLELVLGYHQLVAGLRGMLNCDPSLRFTAAKACDDLTNIHEYHAPIPQTRKDFFMSNVGQLAHCRLERVWRISENSDISLSRSVLFFAIPVSCTRVSVCQDSYIAVADGCQILCGFVLSGMLPRNLSIIFILNILSSTRRHPLVPPDYLLDNFLKTFHYGHYYRLHSLRSCPSENSRLILWTLPYLAIFRCRVSLSVLFGEDDRPKISISG
jgi:serine/threonine protein kinase